MSGVLEGRLSGGTCHQDPECMTRFRLAGRLLYDMQRAIHNAAVLHPNANHLLRRLCVPDWMSHLGDVAFTMLKTGPLLASGLANFHKKQCHRHPCREQDPVLTRLFFVQDLLKPLCTSGLLPYLPLLGGCVTRQACGGTRLMLALSTRGLHVGALRLHMPCLCSYACTWQNVCNSDHTA